MRQVLVTLSHGFVIGNTRHRHVSLRELNGYDEQFLDSIKNELPIFLQSMELIKRVASLENAPDCTNDVFKNLSVGDRIKILLNVRELVFGNVLQCVTSCPSCLEKISIDINIDDLPGSKNPPHLDSEYLLDVENFKMKIRPLNTSDQTSTLLISNKKSSELAEHLLRQCILASKPLLPDNLPSSVVSALSSKLEELDPLAEIELGLSCQSCKNKFERQFDVEKFVLDEIKMRRHDLEQEIHKIAFYYHWDEDTILSLPMKKRQRYVELIDNTLSGKVR